MALRFAAPHALHTADRYLQSGSLCRRLHSPALPSTTRIHGRAPRPYCAAAPARRFAGGYKPAAPGQTCRATRGQLRPCDVMPGERVALSEPLLEETNILIANGSAAHCKQVCARRVPSGNMRDSLASSLCCRLQPVRLRPKARQLSFRRKLRKLCKSAPTDVFVLDFDGVLVDSEPEVRP
jgi:hypothetical protein